MSDLPAHLEQHLGPITGGWSNSTEGDPLGVTLARFAGAPVAGASTYCTLGMSSVPLELDDRRVRHELLAACWDRCFVSGLGGLLAGLSLQVTDRGVALRRGEVLRFGGPLFEGTQASALYAAEPAYFPPGLGVWRGSDPPTVIVWLVPIYDAEAEFVAEHGWDAFENLLQEGDPDLLDLQRAPVV